MFKSLIGKSKAEIEDVRKIAEELKEELKEEPTEVDDITAFCEGEYFIYDEKKNLNTNAEVSREFGYPEFINVGYLPSTPYLAHRIKIKYNILYTLDDSLTVYKLSNEFIYKKYHSKEKDMYEHIGRILNNEDEEMVSKLKDNIQKEIRKDLTKSNIESIKKMIANQKGFKIEFDISVGKVSEQ